VSARDDQALASNAGVLFDGSAAGLPSKPLPLRRPLPVRQPHVFSIEARLPIRAGIAIQKQRIVLRRRLGVAEGALIAAHDDALHSVETGVGLTAAAATQ